MFRYGMLLIKKPLGYVQYNLLRNRSKRPINELKQAIIQRDILELWESESVKVGCQPYMLLIGHDLKIWHDAGIHFQIFRRISDSDWQEVADFSTAHADGLSDWKQESDLVLQIEVALHNILSGQRAPDDLRVMSRVLYEPLSEDLATTTLLLSEVFPFQSVDERRELAAIFQDEELRQFLMDNADSAVGRSAVSSDEDQSANTQHSRAKRGIWSGFLRLFRRSG